MLTVYSLESKVALYGLMKSCFVKKNVFCLYHGLIASLPQIAGLIKSRTSQPSG